MDELKLTLSAGILKPLISKILASVLYKQLGYKIDIQLNDIRIAVNEGTAHIHADIDAETPSLDLVKIVKDLTKIES